MRIEWYRRILAVMIAGVVLSSGVAIFVVETVPKTVQAPQASPSPSTPPVLNIAAPEGSNLTIRQVGGLDVFENETIGKLGNGTDYDVIPIEVTRGDPLNISVPIWLYFNESQPLFFASWLTPNSGIQTWEVQTKLAPFGTQIILLYLALNPAYAQQSPGTFGDGWWTGGVIGGISYENGAPHENAVTFDLATGTA